MKYLIVGDYHYLSLSSARMEDLIEKEMPDALISLGDFDRIDAIEEFADLKESLKSRGIEVIDVVGNHEHAYFTGRYDFNSEALQYLGKNVKDIREELKKSEKAKKYLGAIANPENFIKRFRLGKFNIAVMHGAYGGDLSTAPLEVDESDALLWHRIISEPSILSNLIANFDAMGRRKENLLVRGHDHYHFHGSRKSDSISSYDFMPSEIEIGPSCLNIISPGPFYDGNYAVLEALSQNRVKVSFKVFNHYLVAKK